MRKMPMELLIISISDTGIREAMQQLQHGHFSFGELLELFVTEVPSDPSRS
tara:strand:+ start:96 stop:248 length:153 start_codon:yes stop_codon:yes gene_type:complete